MSHPKRPPPAPIRLCLSALVVVLAVSGVVPTAAQSPTRGVQPVAVQNRQHVQTHEFAGHLGTLPIDAFTKGITASGSYTLHFDPLRAWEVVHFAYSFHVDTHLRADLDALDIQPTHFEVVRLFVTSNYVYKPVYWKAALHNRRLVHGEIFFVAGGGWALLTRSGRPAVDAGLGVRLFATERVSMRLDVRGMSAFILFDDQGALRPDFHNDMWIGLGVSL